jgi:hypothetical protein
MPTPEPLPELATLIASDDGRIVLEGRIRRQLERDALPDFLPRQRWFAAKDAAIDSVQITPLASHPSDHSEHQLTLIEVALRNGGVQDYFLPLSVLWGEHQIRRGSPKVSYAAAKVRRGFRVGALINGAYDEAFARTLIFAIQAGRSVKTPGGSLRFSSSATLRALGGLEAKRRIAGADREGAVQLCGAPAKRRTKIKRKDEGIDRRDEGSPGRHQGLLAEQAAKRVSDDAPSLSHPAVDLDNDRSARALAMTWREQASRDFLTTYVDAMKGAPSYPDNKATAAGLLDLFLLKKAFYEIGYEAATRPHWLPIPVRGVLGLSERREART